MENTEDHQLNEHIWQFTLEQFIEAVKGSIVAWHTYVIRSEPANDAIDRRLRTPDTLQTPLAIHAMTSPRKCCQQPGYSIDTCACTCVHPSDQMQKTLIYQNPQSLGGCPPLHTLSGSNASTLNVQPARELNFEIDVLLGGLPQFHFSKFAKMACISRTFRQPT